MVKLRNNVTEPIPGQNVNNYDHGYHCIRTMLSMSKMPKHVFGSQFKFNTWLLKVLIKRPNLGMRKYIQ